MQSNEKTGELTEINAYMKQMDSELSKTVLSKSFKRAQFDSDDDLDVDSDEADGDEGGSKITSDNDATAEVDLNVLSNILESYNTESEVSTSAGPATALFATMNVKLPDVEK